MSSLSNTSSITHGAPRRIDRKNREAFTKEYQRNRQISVNDSRLEDPSPEAAENSPKNNLINSTDVVTTPIEEYDTFVPITHASSFSTTTTSTPSSNPSSPSSSRPASLNGSPITPFSTTEPLSPPASVPNNSTTAPLSNGTTTTSTSTSSSFYSTTPYQPPTSPLKRQMSESVINKRKSARSQTFLQMALNKLKKTNTNAQADVVDIAGFEVPISNSISQKLKKKIPKKNTESAAPTLTHSNSVPSLRMDRINDTTLQLIQQHQQELQFHQILSARDSRPNNHIYQNHHHHHHAPLSARSAFPGDASSSSSSFHLKQKFQREYINGKYVYSNSDFSCWSTFQELDDDEKIVQGFFRSKLNTLTLLYTKYRSEIDLEKEIIFEMRMLNTMLQRLTTPLKIAQVQDMDKRIKQRQRELFLKLNRKSLGRGKLGRMRMKTRIGELESTFAPVLQRMSQQFHITKQQNTLAQRLINNSYFSGGESDKSLDEDIKKSGVTEGDGEFTPEERTPTPVVVVEEDDDPMGGSEGGVKAAKLQLNVNPAEAAKFLPLRTILRRMFLETPATPNQQTYSSSPTNAMTISASPTGTTISASLPNRELSSSSPPVRLGATPSPAIMHPPGNASAANNLSPTSPSTTTTTTTAKTSGVLVSTKKQIIQLNNDHLGEFRSLITVAMTFMMYGKSILDFCDELEFVVQTLIASLEREAGQEAILLDPSSGETVVIKNEKLLQVINRLFRFLAEWVYYSFYKFDEVVVDRIIEMIRPLACQTLYLPYFEHFFQKLQDKIQFEQIREQTERRLMTSIDHLTQKNDNFDFNKVSSLKISIQLTLIEHDMFTMIRPDEFYGQAWIKANKSLASPNITAIIKRYNMVSMWVVSTILQYKDIKERLKVLCRFISVAWYCVSIRNFCGCFEIVAGLYSTPIYRLKKTWEMLESGYYEKVAQLQELTNIASNYKNYRAQLEKATLPCLPNIAVHLKDLAAIDDAQVTTKTTPVASSSSLASGGSSELSSQLQQQQELINYTKCETVSQVVAQLLQYQQHKYPFKVEAKIRNYLWWQLLKTANKDVKKLNAELLSMSKQLEPPPKASK